MSAPPDLLEWLVRSGSGDSGIDRKALAGVLLDIARSVRPDLPPAPNGETPIDIRLEELRRLLLGREIEIVSRLSHVVEDPEQLALAVSEVLPTAFAEATRDARLGQVLAPALEKAAQSSIRKDPRTLVNILYPLIVPAIRKSIAETIDDTFQSLNESLKHSLTWRGLKWRWEAWRTGAPFAQVVLKHTLVYQVEHAFLIHRHTGLLISHAAAESAATQDPQLVSSMLSAIQDFVRDSFTGADEGLDTLRLGEFRLWSEPGPSATLVAVIRGNPPENLHRTLHDIVTRIHDERHQALEDFDGDSSGFTDIDADLTRCVSLKQQVKLPAQRSFRWLFVTVPTVLLLAGGVWEFRRLQDGRRWDDYLARLRSQPGIVITQVDRRDGKYEVTGLRDPLASDPRVLLEQAKVDPVRVVFHWAPYEALDPQTVLERLRDSLKPAPSVELSIDGNRIEARGAAPSAWLDRARTVGKMLPQGAPVFDFSAVQDSNEQETRRWDDYVERLRSEPGIVVTGAEQHDNKFRIEGLRDPLAADAQQMLIAAGIDPDRVESRWSSYQALDPQIVLKRLQISLEPPPSVSMAVEGNRILAKGAAPLPWLDRARMAARMLPAGAPRLDLSEMQDLSGGAIGKLREAIQSRAIRFDANDSLPAPGQEALLDELARDLNELASLSSTMQVSTRVTLTGHADSVGKGTFNLSLSLARAEAVRALLKKRGVDPDLLAVRGAGALEPLTPEASETARSANRRVSFSVEIGGQT
ncbi:MAG: OmpA family protein [Acidobacteriaceae bacterium]|nr:OmpA family protein [Acidobacteriaceae bacterium]